MCLRLKSPRNVMYCPLAISVHAGTETDREQQCVSRGQPPASHWNQRNHKNVTASVIIPPRCLFAWWPAPENSSEAACFSVSHTHSLRLMFSLSSRSHLWHTLTLTHTDFSLWLPILLAFFLHTHRRPDIAKSYRLQFAFPTENCCKPKAVIHIQTSRHAVCPQYKAIIYST